MFTKSGNKNLARVRALSTCALSLMSQIIAEGKAVISAKAQSYA